MGVFRPVVTAAVATPAAYFLLARPWHLHWGATDAEVQMPLPGDDLIPNPRSLSTRAITIDAAVEQVWPWVVQMGQGRGGFYSYDALENLVGCDIQSADRVMPEFQTLSPGDQFWLASRERYPKSVLVVEKVEPNRLLLLRSDNVGESPDSPGDEFGYTWAFVLQPVNSTSTRFISRGRYSGPSAIVLPMEGVQFVMEREMLRGLKRRAEAARATEAAPR